ncbi:cyclase family protein [Legionella parisiensis]|uniref:Kynurenine formamidase n=1 Tax=Legionella parisiensis TaxID=45071 RepID=A0A1E5JSF8_9GAMM|nr:cyclase family protein [Legionella parisiensis]KTD42190.1 metal-dependent hydrolase [Legionella parisiensis]OEH47452.1 Kynurenine formamidase [Legionella parisiensis]STX72411.1 metal-dependent hydrolase [Legionella parisiensis]
MTFPFKIIDMTHTLSPESPSWDMDCGFSHKTVLNYDECSTAVQFKVQEMSMPAGIGTHIDAPAHCFKKGLHVAQLDLIDHHLITQCVVIDVSHQSHEHYRITRKDILDFEKKHQTIAEHSFVIFYTGWEKHWHDAQQYRNNLVFPCISEEAAQLILERNSAGIGIDTLSPDRPENDYIVHQLMLENKKYIVENVCNATKLPVLGAYSMVLPMKIADLTEAPVRLIGLY